jgi:hypothetical protein
LSIAEFDVQPRGAVNERAHGPGSLICTSPSV